MEESLKKLTEEEITILGNPGKPTGAAGEHMLTRMNQEHYEVTGWALGFWQHRDGEDLLDIGCGGGETLHRLAKRAPGCRLTGVDYSPVSVKMTGERNREAVAAGRLTVALASVEQLPFADESFDKIITVESFYFWPDPAENLKEVRRVLKRGGSFLLVADIYEKDGLSAHARENIRRYHMTNPTPGQFESLFRSARFTHIQVHTQPGTDWICVEGSRA